MLQLENKKVSGHETRINRALELQADTSRNTPLLKQPTVSKPSIQIGKTMPSAQLSRAKSPSTRHNSTILPISGQVHGGNAECRSLQL
jgi:hypothetical protein